MGLQCVSGDVRLNAWASVGFTVFSIKSDCQFVSSLLLASPTPEIQSIQIYLQK